jgi:hypothetical protein
MYLQKVGSDDVNWMEVAHDVGFGKYGFFPEGGGEGCQHL